VAFGVIQQIGLHWTLGVVVTVIVAVALGVILERLVLRPMIGEPIISLIMVTIGLASLLRAIVSSIWGTGEFAFPAFIPNEPFQILGAIVTTDKIWAIVIAALFLGGFSLFFRRSSDGIAMRAVADDQQAALSMGISVKRVFAMAWSIAAVTAAIGGIIIANILGVSGNISGIGLRVFPVVILGGLDSIPGAVIGGIVIGLLEAYAGGFIGGGLSTVIPFVALVIILMIRPYGLFGQEIIERV
jgi:branched-chain amino acid transport system permease protein